MWYGMVQKSLCLPLRTEYIYGKKALSPECAIDQLPQVNEQVLLCHIAVAPPRWYLRSEERKLTLSPMEATTGSLPRRETGETSQARARPRRPVQDKRGRIVRPRACALRRHSDGFAIGTAATSGGRRARAKGNDATAGLWLLPTAVLRIKLVYI